MSQELNKYTNFHNQILSMNNHDEIVSYYIEYRNYLISNNPERALFIIKEGYYKYEKFNNQFYKHKILIVWASTLIILERFNEALEKSLICLKYFLKQNDNNFISTIIGNMASIFYRLEMYNYALYLWKIVQTKYTNIQDNYSVNLLINNMSMVKMNFFHNTDFGIEAIDDMIRYYENKKIINRKDLLILFFASHNKARYYNLKNDNLKAIEILEKLLIDYEKNDFLAQKIDVYFELGVLYKKINNEDKMIFCFKSLISIGEELSLKLLFSNVYNELYNFYKAKNDYKKAFNCLKKYNYYRSIEIELKRKVNLSINEMGIDNRYFAESNIVNIFNNDNLETEKFIFIENLNGEIVKFEAMDIIYVQNKDSKVKVYLANRDCICIKGLYKDFINQLLSLFPNSNIFFEANARDTIFNLFWISKISIENKIVYLRPYHSEIPISLSKRKWLEFKNLLKI